jgi:hypothetical protein
MGATPGAVIATLRDESGQDLRMDMFEWRSSYPFGIEAEVDPDTLIFHYTSIERAAAIALTGSLLLGPLTMLNDPQESQVRRLIGSTTDLFAPDYNERKEAFERQVHQLRSLIRLACFTSDAVLEKEGTVKRADGRGFARSAMWAHYGDGHEGACIAFDRAVLELRAGELAATARCGPVTYSPGLNVAVYQAESVDIDHPDLGRQHKAVVDSLFTKNSDWSPERECRIVVDGWTDAVCAIPIADAVRGVAFGVSLKPHQVPLVAALRDAFGLKHEQVALMMHENGSLAAMPIHDAAGIPHRWTDDELRSGAVYDWDPAES